MSRIDEIQQKILELEGIDYIEHKVYLEKRIKQLQEDKKTCCNP